jgi:hypothetical protein
MKHKITSYVLLLLFISCECFSIAPPKSGVKPSPELLNEYKEIQKSYNTGYWAERIQTRYELLQKNPTLFKTNSTLAIDTTKAPTLLG